MKRRLVAKVLALNLILVACGSLCIAQTSHTAPNPQSNEVVSENDQLPFMHTDQSSEVQEPSSGGLLLKTLGAMILIIGLIFVAAWGARKLGFGGIRSGDANDETDLAIISTVSLGSGRTMSTVRFGERVLLVGSTPQAFTLLAEGKRVNQMSFQNSRSVAEMLGDESGDFDAELDCAESRLAFPPMSVQSSR